MALKRIEAEKELEKQIAFVSYVNRESIGLVVNGYEWIIRVKWDEDDDLG